MCQIIAAVDIFFGFRPDGGESTPGGWIIAAGYFFVSWLCRRTGRQELRLRQMGFGCLRPRFWLFMSWCLFLLGISQVFGLESWLTSLGRHFAAGDGWYPRRRHIQVSFILAICIVGLPVFIIGIFHGRGQWNRYLLAWLGTLALLGFTAIRAVSFHFIDMFLSHRWGFISTNRICELSGIAIVALGAWKSTWLQLTSDLLPPPSRVQSSREIQRAAWDQIMREYHGGTNVNNS